MRPTPMRRVAALLAVVLLAAAVLRLSTLEGKSLWGDEGDTWFYTTLAGPRAVVGHVLRADVHPPAFHVSEWTVVKALGSSEFTLRLLPALAGVALAGLAFAIARETLGPGAGLIAAAIVSVHPYFLQLSQEARAHAIGAVLAPLAIFFARRLVAGDWRPGAVAGYAVAALAGLYTVHSMIPVLVATTVWFAVENRSRRRDWSRWILLHAAILVLALPDAYFLFEQYPRRPAVSLDPAAWLKAFVGIAVHLSEGYRYAHTTLDQALALLRDPAAVAWLALGPLALGTLLLCGRRAVPARPMLRGLAMAGLLPVLLLALLGRVDLLKARYLAVSGLPLLVVVVAAGALAAPGRVRLVAGIAWGAVLAAGAAHELGATTNTIHKEDCRGAAAFARSLGEPRPVVLTCWGVNGSAAFGFYGRGDFEVHEACAPRPLPGSLPGRTRALVVLGRAGAACGGEEGARLREALAAAGFAREEARRDLGANLCAVAYARQPPGGAGGSVPPVMRRAPRSNVR